MEAPATPAVPPAEDAPPRPGPRRSDCIAARDPYPSGSTAQSHSTPANNNYPRLLPPPIPNILTGPYVHSMLTRLTATLRGDHPHEVNLAFVALCHYNLMHLASEVEGQEVQQRLETMSGIQLVELACSAGLQTVSF